ncbi:CATRA conflict system CASPASE/TPR repeat-associated protein [Actinomadura chokoriensis]|uniref:CATRA conflict system CASPASE/TPR repeat-associated protein n=1 Tax=Actinomadura chokoriensis TaxID=454156 RepID=UPI0031F883FF
MLLQAEALVAHVFVAAEGGAGDEDRRYLRGVWRACDEVLGMTDGVAGLDADPPAGWDETSAASGVLAARTRPGGGVEQAILRRERDVFCLSVILEPDPSEGIGWAELDARWSRALAAPTRGTVGTARIFVARLGADATDRVRAGELVADVPVEEGAAALWPERGVAVPEGFMVWEASAPDDRRVERRLVVIARRDGEHDLSDWTWIGPGAVLPPLAGYLLNAARLRFELRIWDDGEGTRRLREDTDAVVGRLLATVTASAGRGRGEAELIDASRELVSLQTRAMGLADRTARLREMSRTVAIGAANLAAFGGGAPLGGLFADDRALAEWFGRRLDDEIAYLDAASQRAGQVGALADQLLLRDRQRRQESVNLGLTGVVGAVLMVLAAIQSLGYDVPLPKPVEPAVVTALGASALLASLVVLRVVVPDQRWPRVLVRAAVGGVAASLGWVAASAIGGAEAGPGWAMLGAGVGFIAGVLGVSVPRRLRSTAGR